MPDRHQHPAAGQDAFADASYGLRRVGTGRRAAILVVDLQVAFTSGRYPMGQSQHVQRAVEETAALLDFARPLGVPVASCCVGWYSERDMSRWKVDAVYDGMFYGDAGLDIDSRLEGKSDFHFIKGAPSMFFGTPLNTFLVREGVDTVMVTGCTTSGCVRATVVDAFSHGYHVLIPQACCGDQDQEAHRGNLRDMERRYADVIDGDEARAVLTKLHQGASTDGDH